MTREEQKEIEYVRNKDPERFARSVETARRALADALMVPAKLCVACGGWLVSRKGTVNFEVRRKSGERTVHSGTLVDLPYYSCQKCGKTFVEKADTSPWMEKFFSNPEYDCIIHTGFTVVERAYQNGEVVQPITEKQRVRLEEFIASTTSA